MRRSSAGAARVTGSARCGSGRRASRTACAGSATPRWRSRCSAKRALERELHGGVLADKQGIQWQMAESTMELYQGKLMVLHAAYLIENGLPFRHEVSMCKHHVANMLVARDRPRDPGARRARLLDRHRRSRACCATRAAARLVDGADEVHISQIAPPPARGVPAGGDHAERDGLRLALLIAVKRARRDVLVANRN